MTYNPHPYGSVNVATSEYNSPKRDTNVHNPSVTTTSIATVPGEDTAEDERKPSADVTDTSAQSRSGGCEGFVAPVIWNSNPAGDQSPLSETKTKIGAPPTVSSPSIDDVDMKERSVERKHDDDDEDHNLLTMTMAGVVPPLRGGDAIPSCSLSTPWATRPCTWRAGTICPS